MKALKWIGSILAVVFVINLFTDKSADQAKADTKKDSVATAAAEPPKPPTAAEIKDQKEAEAAMAKALREGYQEKLQNAFLDGGLNIKVKVYGKNKDRISLSYALFNEVWRRKMETEGMVTTWRDMGFTYAEMKDGYNYAEYWEFKK